MTTSPSSGETEPNTLIYVAYIGGVSLAVGLLILGVGLVRGRRQPAQR